jgi:type II secretory pathway pseudopilin PulG
MIGVLSVVALLSALVLPRILSTYSLAQVTATSVAINNVKSATLTYYERYGRFGNVSGQAVTTTNDPAISDWGTQVLLRGGFLERPFRVPIGSSAVIRLSPALSAATAATTSNAAYNLDGIDPDPNDAKDGRWVVEVQIRGVAIEDAVQLNLQLDGAASTLAADVLNRRDTVGRVKYDATQGQTDVLIYLAHR